LVPQVDIQGYSGDLINGGFPKRLRERLEEADKQSYLYTHAVILGGVNDINLNRSEPEHVFRGLQSLYDTTLTQSPTTQVIACTIMENMYKNNESDFTQRDEARKEVNRLLRAVYVDNKVQGISLLDLEKLLPYDGLSEWEKFVYYDDKLHLSIVGYERLGNLVYDHIIRQLASSESK
jgi:lysophospholipase L1-like esterase